MRKAAIEHDLGELAPQLPVHGAERYSRRNHTNDIRRSRAGPGVRGAGTAARQGRGRGPGELPEGRFLDRWCGRVMRSRIEPMKRIARSLRAHRELILNWFRARGEVSAAAVEGLNNKLKVITRRAYGFRTFEATQVVLYHNLGALPEPETTHRFW
ncbi:MAG: transposase [Planctomycetota bacterium]